MTLSRFSSVAVLGALMLVLPALPRAQNAPSPYFQVSTLPISVDGRGLQSFAYDPGTDRLYVASDYAVFRTDPKAANPRLDEIARRRFGRIEIAPDLGRLFFLGINEVGYIDVTSGAPEAVRIASLDAPVDLAYEPTRQELYVSTFRGPVRVFDARSSEPGASIEVPGWTAASLEAVPGRVFLTVDAKGGLFSIDAAARRIEPWPVIGRISAPAYLDADPEGRYLFMAYEREMVAIDVAKATVIGRVVTAMTPAIAFDPETRLLIATWNDDPPPTRVVAYEVSERGLREVAQLRNPAIGRSGLEPIYGGFVQRGVRDLIVWGRRSE